MIEACKHSMITSLLNNPNAELRQLYFRELQEQIDTILMLMLCEATIIKAGHKGKQQAPTEDKKKKSTDQHLLISLMEKIDR